MPGPIGEIRRDAVYPKCEFQNRTGLKDAAFRQAKQDGLKTIRVHRRVYILGEHWYEYLKLMSEAAE